MTAIWTILGVALIIVVFNDVFQTLVRPSGTGRLTHLIFRATWALPLRRGGFVFAIGPLMFIGVISMWVLGATVGWALVYLPHIPDGFAYSGVDPSRYHPFAEAFTISLVTLTTVGFGDAVATGDVLRVAAPFEALAGFALLTACVSWLMQLYPALTRRRALAIELTGMADAGVVGRFGQLSADRASTLLSGVTRSLATVVADFIQNSETFYFVEKDRRTSLAAATSVALQLRDVALASSQAQVRSDGQVLASVLDEYARVLGSQYSGIGGESTDDVLTNVAAAYGHDFEDTDATRSRDV